VPEFDPGLKWKECVDCDGQSPPVTVAKFMLDNLSRALPLDQQASVIVYVTDIYESVKQQMKEEREVRDET
jgi:hypothetical protein